jgi:hypothetical protein
MYQNIDYVHLTRKDRRQLSRNIKDTLANLKSKKESATFPCIIDLTEDSIDEMFKYYDTPNEVIPAKDIDSVYLVRPPEQTLAERQTEQYRLELLIDIMEGKVSPNVHIIILTDRDFKQKLFIYDGQHQTLLLAMFKNGKLVFETSHLRKAVEQKKVDYSDDFNNHNSWVLIDEFLEKYTEDTFDYSTLVNSVPELNEYFNSQNKMKIVGQMHFMDGRSAACLMKKLNEHKSSHSTAQRVKSDLTGKPIHRLLFESELQVDDKKTYLSDIVKSIHLFNRSNNPLPKGIPMTFSYDKFSDDYTNMNYDQYLILVYQLILSKTKIYIDDSNKYCYKFDINLNADDSVLFAHGNSKFFENDVFAKYGLKDDVYENWYGVFSKLEIDDEASFVKFLENILTLAKITTDESFVNEINQFSKNINGLTKPISIEMAEIESAYPNEDRRPDDIHKQYDSLKKQKSKLNEFKLDKAYNLIVFYSMILDSHLRSLFSLKDWMIGYLKTINVNTTFQAYITANVGEITSPGQASTPKRFKLWNRYFGNKSFNDLVKLNLSGSDKSLWTRFEADEYFDKILDHEGDRLYKCPITAKWITKNDFESHHLSFRSKNPQKEFKYWFPLSSKWNGLISDDTEKNIVSDNGTFLEACDALMDHLKIKEKNSSSKKEKSDWSSSYRTIQNWKEKAEIFFEEEEAKNKKKNK